MKLFFLPYSYHRHSLLFKGVLLTLMTLTACVSKEQSNKSVNVDAMSSAEVAAFVREWQQLKPQVDELTAMQDDLSIILDEVNKQSDLNNLPKKYTNQRTTDHVFADVFEYPDVYANDNSIDDNEAVPSASTANGKPIAKGESSGISMPDNQTEQASLRQKHAAHIGYFFTSQAAWQDWDRLAKQLPQLATTVNAKVFTEKRSEQTLYSLRIGPFVGEQTTQRVCELFSAYSITCKQVQFIGANRDK